MMQYKAVYESEERPKILKVFSAESGESFTARIGLGVKEEIDQISTDTIYDHIRNLISYIKKATSEISITEKEEQVYEAWPIKGWEEVESAKDETIRWWEIAYFRDEEEPSDV